MNVIEFDCYEEARELALDVLKDARFFAVSVSADGIRRSHVVNMDTKEAFMLLEQTKLQMLEEEFASN